MCQGTTVSDDYLIERHSFHPALQGIYTRDISVDRCIGPEVAMLLEAGVGTAGHSCCGHQVIQAHAFIYPEYIKRAQHLGYEVAIIQHEGWPEDRIEYAIPLKTGTQNKPLIIGRVHK